MMRVVKLYHKDRHRKESKGGFQVCLVLMIHMDISASGMTLCARHSLHALDISLDYLYGQRIALFTSPITPLHEQFGFVLSGAHGATSLFF